MNTELNQALETATQLFAVVVTLCVLVTGFFIGRHWLKKLSGEAPASAPSSRDIYRAYRSGGTSPRDMQKIPGGWRKL